MWKKLKLLVVLVTLCVLIASCQEKNQLLSVDMNQMQPLEMSADAEVFSFLGDDLFYLRRDDSGENESAPCLIYHHNCNTGTSQYLGKIILPDMYINPAVQIENALYFLGGLPGNQIGVCKVTLDTFELSQIYQLEQSAFFPRLCSYQDHLVLLYVLSEQEDIRDYQVMLLDTEGREQKLIVERECEFGSGTYLACMDADREYLYILEEEIRGKDRAYRILCCDSTGEIDRCEIDLSEVIQVNAEGLDEDVVMEMKKVGEYWALNTLNRRFYLFRTKDDTIQKEPLNQLLDQSTPGKFRFLANSSPEAEHLYILPNNNSTKMYLLEAGQPDLQEITLSVDEEWDFLEHCGTQMVMQKRTGDDKSQREYCLLSLPK